MYSLLFVFAFVALLTTSSVRGEAVCACARNYMPVCANNGRTYPNKCVFECAANSPIGRSAKLRMVANTGCDDMQNNDNLNDVSADIFSDSEN